MSTSPATQSMSQNLLPADRSSTRDGQRTSNAARSRVELRALAPSASDGAFQRAFRASRNASTGPKSTDRREARRVEADVETRQERSPKATASKSRKRAAATAHTEPAAEMAQVDGQPAAGRQRAQRGSSSDQSIDPPALSVESPHVRDPADPAAEAESHEDSAGPGTTPGIESDAPGAGVSVVAAAQPARDGVSTDDSDPGLPGQVPRSGVANLPATARDASPRPLPGAESDESSIAAAMEPASADNATSGDTEFHVGSALRGSADDAPGDQPADSTEFDGDGERAISFGSQATRTANPGLLTDGPAEASDGELPHSLLGGFPTKQDAFEGSPATSLVDTASEDASATHDSRVSIDAASSKGAFEAHKPGATDFLEVLGTQDSPRTSAGSPGASPARGHDFSAQAAQAAPRASLEDQFAVDNHSRIITGVRTNLLPNGGSMNIRLDPPHLGALQVSVHVRDGVLTASFETNSDDATRLLSHSLSQLKSALESQGVSVERLQVQQSPRDARPGADDGSRGQRGQTGEGWGGQAQDSPARRDQERRELMSRLWRRLTEGSDPLDMVA